MRHVLHETFSSIYIFNLRGDIRKNMMSQGKAQEGDNIFDAGSMSGICISLFVKNTEKHDHNIYYHDIGNSLDLKEKKEIISKYGSIKNIEWDIIEPNEYDDWIGQRDLDFNQYITMGNKKDKNTLQIFNDYSLGVATNRDAWCYNFSRLTLEKNIKKTINFFNSSLSDKSLENSNDLSHISWTRGLKKFHQKNEKLHYDTAKIVKSTYRPFTKTNLYFDKYLNEMQLKIPYFFPNGLNNILIVVSGVGARRGFSTFIVNQIFDIQTLDNGQAFPLYLYEESSEKKNNSDLFNNTESSTIDRKYTIKDGINDAGLKHFQEAYSSEKISKEDIFYYVYGLLHNEDYHTRYADNLTKELPRIPCVKKAEDFWTFSKAGRDLAHWHLNYETVEPYKAKLDLGGKSLKQLEDKDFYVTNMKFAKKGKEKIKDTVIYNSSITIREIPLEAYDYIVNGKSALEWVMDRQSISTHKDSGIVNDANDWAIETMGDAKYPLELFLRVITVSLETMKIVKNLPKLDI